jgi:hypothetical protein
MLLRYERNRDAESQQLSGLEVLGYRCGPWREYRGEEGEYLCTDRRWERIGEVRKRTDVPLQWWGHVSRGRRMECLWEQSASSVWV